MTDAQIKIIENGPYIVTGSVPLTEEAIGIDDEGNAWTWEARAEHPLAERMALCRCGKSQTKPFCDGSHGRLGFDGTETASRRPFDESAEKLSGPTMDLLDDKPLCSFARFCDGYGAIWNTVHETDDAGKRELVAHQATHCPSGRLVIEDHDRDGLRLEPEHPPSIVLVEDPQKDSSGPLYVRGGITLVSSDGYVHETRNRVTLCRCGASENKPFCDGTHAHVGFRAHDEPPPAA
jgi:CDGSH-type Zn-finger protein